jgi:protein-S-isoprenylcysteine O-methyltransferase Ste14
VRNFVVAGPYRHMRNPMIAGVLLVLLAEAAAFRSWPLLGWAAVFLALNTAYFILSEEPGLERRFGDAYRRYKAAVPRWTPRRRPYDAEDAEKSA